MSTVRVTVEVTAEDIQEGFPKSMCFCPIARAISRVVKATTKVRVGIGYCKIMMNNFNSLITLPEITKKFVLDFDHGPGPYKPFSFEMELPEYAYQCD